MKSRAILGVLIAVAVSSVLVVPYVTAAEVFADLGVSLWSFVGTAIAGYVGGAVAAVGARRVPERWLLVGGSLVTGVVALSSPHVPGAVYLTLFGALNVVAGALFVVTSVLVVDAAPARARATALGCWALGGAVGGLTALAVADRVAAWQTQTTISATTALAVSALTVCVLAPRRHRAPLEAASPEHSAAGPALAALGAAGPVAGRARARVRVAAGVSGVCLVVHTLAAGLVVLYAATRLGYPAPRIRGVLTFYWVAYGLAVVVGGITSDAFSARKPFLVGGAALSAGGVTLLALHAHPSYAALAGIVVLIAAGAGIVSSAGPAALTETDATGPPHALATWGAAQRVAAALALAALVVLVPSASPQADDGPTIRAIQARYPAELAVARRLDDDVVAALAKDPDDLAARTAAVSRLSGLPTTVVRTVLFTQRTYPDEIKTYWASIPRGFGRYWLSGPDDPNPWATWVNYIARQLNVDGPTAAERLRALDRAKDADFPTTLKYGTQVNAATAQLDAITRIPADDLRYLRERGPALSRAGAAAPDEWRRWWWVIAATHLALVPLVWLFGSSHRGKEAGRE